MYNIIGLGYSIKYYYIFTGGHEDGVVTLEHTGAEFRLFNKILIWSWEK